MMSKFLYLLVFIFLSYFGFSQHVLRGRVISDETKKPLPSVSVYLNNTSLGVTTDEKGLFVLQNIPGGKVTLVASSVGYETYVKFIDPGDFTEGMTIRLKLKPEELQSVVLKSFDPEGWQNWGKLFTELFIGTSPNAASCIIQNHEFLRFRLNNDNTLSVFSRTPIQVMNYVLGYEIIYKLEEFSFDLSSQVLTQKGFAYFKDLSTLHPKRAEKYGRKRKEVYQGSLMHFMRAFFLNHLDTAGFQLKSLAKISNPGKDRAKFLFSLHKDSVLIDTVLVEIKDSLKVKGGTRAKTKTFRGIADSTDYYKYMLRQPDSVISRQLISADSIGFALDSNIAGLYFVDSLEVTYTLKKNSGKYRMLSQEARKENFPVSQFVFTNKRPVYVFSNGYFYDVYDLKITGYWAWWETMANKLPYDYDPGAN